MTYRNPDLLALARLAPHCMSCDEPNVGDVVAAHSNQSRDGKGGALKAHDYRVAYCCFECHGVIDQGSLPREVRVGLWEAAHRKTIGWLFESGRLVVADEARQPERPPKARRTVRKGRKLPSRPFSSTQPGKTPAREARLAKPASDRTKDHP